MNKKLICQDPKYKIFSGRVFRLRNHKHIPATKTKIIGCRTRKYYEAKKTFGEAVMILDETNSKVLVYSIEKDPLWIAKSFLLEEIELDTDNNDVLNLNELINKLLNENEQISFDDRKQIVKLLRK